MLPSHIVPSHPRRSVRQHGIPVCRQQSVHVRLTQIKADSANPAGSSEAGLSLKPHTVKGLPWELVTEVVHVNLAAHGQREQDSVHTL